MVCHPSFGTQIFAEWRESIRRTWPGELTSHTSLLKACVSEIGLGQQASCTSPYSAKTLRIIRATMIRARLPLKDGCRLLAIARIFCTLVFKGLRSARLFLPTVLSS